MIKKGNIPYQDTYFGDLIDCGKKEFHIKERQSGLWLTEEEV
jgi:hypothetical protein